jgi:DNA-directed RNA polymerase subunit D
MEVEPSGSTIVMDEKLSVLGQCLGNGKPTAGGNFKPTEGGDLSKNTAGGGDLLRVLDEGPLAMRMLLTGIDSSFANAWRRAIMSEVEVMAIDRLEVHQNTTMLHDDMLFHRLGLIPLKGRVDDFSCRSECDCDDGCKRCMGKFTLRVANYSDEPIEVMSSDLVASEEKLVAPVSPNILIVKLHKNQELSFTAYAIKSTARMENNAKWNPVTIASYRPTAKVTVNSNLVNHFLTPDERKRVCLAEPAQVLVYNEQTKQIEPHPDASLRCTYTGDFIEQLADILHPPGADSNTDDTQSKTDAKTDVKMDEKTNAKIEGGGSRATEIGELEKNNGRVMRHPTELVHPMISMIPNRNQFLFPIVSTGCMPPREIARRALAALRKRLVAIQILTRRRKLLTPL